MRQGRMQMFGPRDRVLASLTTPARGPATNLKPVYLARQT